MKPHVLGAVGAALLISLPAAPAVAAGPSGGCPNETWQTSVYPLGWQPGDAMDPDGENLIWSIGVAGVIEEFGSVEAALAAFGGFASLEDFYATVFLPEVQKIDHNGDGVLCFKPFSDQGGKPAYLVNSVDNTSHSQG